MSIQNKFCKSAVALSLIMATSVTAEFDESVISMQLLKKNIGAEAIVGIPLERGDFEEGNPFVNLLVFKITLRIVFYQ